MASLSRSATRGSRGFTLLELAVTAGIAALLATAATVAFGSLRAGQRLGIAVSDLAAAARHAQANAQAARDDAGWGVAVRSGAIVVYRGASYATRSASADQRLTLPFGVAVSGLSEVNYGELTGATADIGTMTVSNDYGSRHLTFTARTVVVD